MIVLSPVSAQNWRAITRVRPTDAQQEWVADAAYYLCLRQGQGLGRATVEALLALWEGEEPALSGADHRETALSVAPDNEVALRLYRSLGFSETGELSDDEVVLRRPRLWPRA